VAEEVVKIFFLENLLSFVLKNVVIFLEINLRMLSLFQERKLEVIFLEVWEHFGFE